MARGDALDLKVLGSVLVGEVSWYTCTYTDVGTCLRGVVDVAVGSRDGMHGKDSRVTHSCKFENLGGQVFKHGCNIDGSLGADAHLVLGVLLEEALDTTTGELRGERMLVYPGLLEMGEKHGFIVSCRDNMEGGCRDSLRVCASWCNATSWYPTSNIQHPTLSIEYRPTGAYRTDVELTCRPARVEWLCCFLGASAAEVFPPELLPPDLPLPPAIVYVDRA